VIHANDLVPYMGTKTTSWYHGGTAYPTQAIGLFPVFRLNTPLQSGASHQLPGYFAALAPLHKNALERTLKDLHRDRIYSRNMKHTNTVTTDSWDDSGRRKAFGRGDKKTGFRDRDTPDSMDSFQDQDISISRPSRRKQPQSPPDRGLRRSKSLSSLGLLDNISNSALTSDMEDLTGQINETKMSMQSLIHLLSVIANEDISMDSDLSEFAHLKLPKEHFFGHNNGQIPQVRVSDFPETPDDRHFIRAPLSSSLESRQIRRSHSLNTLMNSELENGDTTPEIHKVKISGSRGKSDSNSSANSPTPNSSVKKNGQDSRGRIQFRPSVSGQTSPVIPPRIVAPNPYSIQQQQVVPVLPNRAAVQTIPSRQSQAQQSAAQQQAQQQTAQQSPTNTPVKESTDHQTKRTPSLNSSKLANPTENTRNRVPSGKSVESPRNTPTISPQKANSQPQSSSNLTPQQQQELLERRAKERLLLLQQQQQALSQQNSQKNLNPNEKPTNPTVNQRVPKDVRQVRSRSKSLSELVNFPPQHFNEEPSENATVQNNAKRALFSQLKQHLALLQNVLNLMNPTNATLSYEKLVDTIMGIIGRLQSGQSQSGPLERSLYNFSRVGPKFRQIVEAYKMGTGNPQIFTEILVLFKRVTGELLETVSQIV